jgi:parvulin-like peptidyl-prolyl isomerase
MKRLVLLAATVALVTGCGDLFEPAAAVVNDRKITVDDVNGGLDQLEKTRQYEQLAEQGDVDAFEREFEQAYLSQLIRRAVFDPKAAELGVEVTEADVTERIEEIKNDFPSDSAFEEFIEEQGITLEQLPVLVRDNILSERLRAEVVENVEPAEEDVRSYYEENIADYRQTRAQHILVNSRDRAADIAARLKAATRKEVDDLFDSLARRFSTDKSNANRGGDLGYYTSGELARAFVDAAAELKLGEISDPVETEFGWHVIRVTDRRTKSLAQVSDQISEIVVGPAEDETWQSWVVAAYEEADVEVNPRYGELDIETQLVINPPADSIPGAEATATPAPAATDL